MKIFKNTALKTMRHLRDHYPNFWDNYVVGKGSRSKLKLIPNRWVLNFWDWCKY